jgi:MFS family permease
MIKEIAKYIGIVACAVLIVGYFIRPSLDTAVGIDLILWTTIILGFAAFLGIISLTKIHTFNLLKPKTDRQGISSQQQKLLSLILLVSMYGTILIGVTSSDIFGNIYQYIYNSIYGAMFGILGPFFVVATYRAVKFRSIQSAAFIISIVLGALVNISIISGIPIVVGITDWFSNTIVTGGSRGMTIIFALGVIVLAVPYLLGKSTQYHGSE